MIPFPFSFSERVRFFSRYASIEHCFKTLAIYHNVDVLQATMDYVYDIEPQYRQWLYFPLADPALLKPLLQAIAQASGIETPKHKATKEIFGEMHKMFG